MRTRKFTRGIALPLAFFALALLLSTCGGSNKRAMNPLSIGSDGSPAPRSLNGTLAELAALEIPEGVDPVLYQQLKDALAKLLTAKSVNKIVSIPPVGEANKVTDLAITDNGDGAFEFSWHYRNLGDYDQDGTVGISDITPIAMHYGETYDIENTNCLLAVVDGSGNGLVDIADITPLAQSFGVECAGYHIEKSNIFEGTFILAQDVPLDGATGDGRLEFAEVLENVSHIYYRVQPYDSEGMPGVPSEPVQFPGGTPVIEGVVPTSGFSGEQITFSAEVTGGAVVYYAWDFDGGAEPNLSSEQEPTVTLQAPGDYAAAVTVGNPYGEDTFDFELSVEASAPEILWVQPTTGQQGTEVEFSAQVIGSPTLIYAWDFGGGANPDTSDFNTPIVILGDVGEYDASLIVTNALGEDTFNFTLVVTEEPVVVDPPEITGVEPTEGYAGDYVKFTATVEGTPPFDYAWDFGGGATPNAPQLASPTVMLGDPGSYPASLTALNSAGEDIFEFTLVVLEIPTVTVDGRIVEYENEYVGVPGITVEITDGDFAPGITDGEGYYKIPDVPVGYHTVKPTDSGWLFWPGERGMTMSEEHHTVNFTALKTDWHVRVIDDWVPEGGNSSLAVVEGYPGVSYYWRYDAGSTQLRYKRADDDDGLVWDSAAVTVAYSGMPPSSVGRFNSLAVVSGIPAISCAGSPYYWRAQNAIGSEWGSRILVAEDTTAHWTSLLVVNGSPAIAYNDRYDADGIKYVRATDEAGNEWGAPVSLYDGTIDNSVRMGFAIINGNPAVSYPDYSDGPNKLMFRRAEDANGSSWSLAVTVDSGSSYGVCIPLIEVSGSPAIAYVTGGIFTDYTLNYVRATNAQGSEWGEPVTIASQEEYIWSPSMVICDGYPAVAYGQGFKLKFVRSDDIIGSVWGESSIVDWHGVGGPLSASIINGHPAVSYYSDDYDELRYAVYIP